MIFRTAFYCTICGERNRKRERETEREIGKEKGRLCVQSDF